LTISLAAGQALLDALTDRILDKRPPIRSSRRMAAGVITPWAEADQDRVRSLQRAIADAASQQILRQRAGGQHRAAAGDEWIPWPTPMRASLPSPRRA
jgi:hypothetical protein